MKPIGSEYPSFDQCPASRDRRKVLGGIAATLGVTIAGTATQALPTGTASADEPQPTATAVETLWNERCRLLAARESLDHAEAVVDAAFERSRPSVPDELIEAAGQAFFLEPHREYRQGSVIVRYLTADKARILLDAAARQAPGTAFLTEARCRRLINMAESFEEHAERVWKARQEHPIEREIDACIDALDEANEAIISAPASKPGCLAIKLRVLFAHLDHGEVAARWGETIMHQADELGRVS